MSAPGDGRRARRRVPLVVVLAVGLGVAAVLALGDLAAGTGAPSVLGPGPVTVDVRIEHSRFVPDHVRVAKGTTVTFRVRNDDPIGHELIVGPPEVHARHESGTEGSHPPVPGEVSVGPLATASTTSTVEQTVVFACHLPGHLAYGMRGEVEADD